MENFSSRYDYTKNEIQLHSVSEKLRKRIYAAFYAQEFNTSLAVFKISMIEKLLGEFGILYTFPDNNIQKHDNSYALEQFVCNTAEWFTVYDFIEKYLFLLPEEKRPTIVQTFNRILQEEVSGYRIVDNLVVPITNENELATIEMAKTTEYDSVNNHISKALSLFADRTNPDYENSIKESISAVEAMCCIITGMTGAGATLGKAIKRLKDKGVHIHSALENAFTSLYGYTSDEGGIRHGCIDFANAPSEDAKFMLVSCSAFVNYLIEKWRKANSEV